MAAGQPRMWCCEPRECPTAVDTADNCHPKAWGEGNGFVCVEEAFCELSRQSVLCDSEVLRGSEEGADGEGRSVASGYLASRRAKSYMQLRIA